MGTSVSFSCECGFSGSSDIGGGRMSFTELCLFPCYCEKCENIVEINIYKDMKCHECRELTISYTDPSLIGIPGELQVADWADFKLSNGSYKCPKCRKMSLYFQNTGFMWD